MNLQTITAEDGKINYLLSEKDLKDLVEQTSKETTSKIVSEMKAVNPPPLQPAKEGEEYGETKNETPSKKNVRLQKALTQVRGGTLAVENAPKEIKAIRYFKAQMDNDILTLKALSEGSAADGGNLVPTEFGTDLKVAIEEYSISADCTNHSMMTNELDLRSVTTKPVVYQVGEAVAVTEAATQFGKPSLTAKAFAGLQVMSKEVFADNNVGLYQRLIDLFAEQLAAKRDHEIMIGSAFTGYFGSSTPVTTTLASTSIQDITYKDLVNCSNSISLGKLGTNAKWYMHRNTWGYIQGIVDNNGRPIVLNPWDAKQRMLLGYPVVLSEQITNAGFNVAPTDASGTAYIGFGNLKWIDFGVRQEVTSQLLVEGTAASINLGEQRSLGLIIDTRWGLVVSIPSNLAMIKTAS